MHDCQQFIFTGEENQISIEKKGGYLQVSVTVYWSKMEVLEHTNSSLKFVSLLCPAEPPGKERNWHRHEEAELMKG